jgi:hypothetical protein
MAGERSVCHADATFFRYGKKIALEKHAPQTGGHYCCEL